MSIPRHPAASSAAGLCAPTGPAAEKGSDRDFERDILLTCACIMVAIVGALAMWGPWS